MTAGSESLDDDKDRYNGATVISSAAVDEADRSNIRFPSVLESDDDFPDPSEILGPIKKEKQAVRVKLWMKVSGYIH